MRVNRAYRDGKYHVDTFDLYNAKARTAFINAAADEMAVKDDVVKRDLGRALLKLEHLQDEAIRKALEVKAPVAVEIPEVERGEALALLRAPDLLDLILRDMAPRIGGEETIYIYLATSRKLEIRWQW